MELDAVPVVIGIAGFVILWGAVRNRNPIDVIQLVLKGESPLGARPLDPVAASVAGATAEGSAQAGATNAQPSGFIPAPVTHATPILPR